MIEIIEILRQEHRNLAIILDLDLGAVGRRVDHRAWVEGQINVSGGGN